MGKHKPKEYNPNNTSCELCGRSVKHSPGKRTPTFCTYCENDRHEDDILLGAFEMLKPKTE